MIRPRRPRLSLDLLRAFESAARHMNFTHAARELFVTQSAISRAVKTLEHQLDRALFRRAKRGLALTDAGRALHQAVGQALATIAKATGRLDETGIRQILTVTTNVATASLWLVPRLPRFARAHPGTDIRVLATNTIVNLEREQIDIALRHFPPESRPANVAPCIEERVFPVCAPSLARRRRLKSPAQLSEHVLLRFETYTSLGPWIDWTLWLESCGLSGLAPAGVMHFSHYDHVIQAAMDGCGVALGRYPLLADHLRNGRLVAPFGTRGIPSGSLHLITARQSRELGTVRSFAAWIELEARRDECRSVRE